MGRGAGRADDPRDLVLLIDRFNVLFGRPGTIIEGRSLSATITTEPLPVDHLQKIVELTRGLADTRAPEASPRPRLPRRPENFIERACVCNPRAVELTV